MLSFSVMVQWFVDPGTPKHCQKLVNQEDQVETRHEMFRWMKHHNLVRSQVFHLWIQESNWKGHWYPERGEYQMGLQLKFPRTRPVQLLWLLSGLIDLILPELCSCDMGVEDETLLLPLMSLFIIYHGIQLNFPCSLPFLFVRVILPSLNDLN